MVTTEYSLVKSNFIFHGTPPHARIPWRIFHGYDGVFPGEYSMFTTEYSLVKSNFILQGTPPHARIPWRIFHGYDRVFPGQIKFYFTRDPPPRENSLENIPWLRQSIPWSNQILFYKGPPPTREFPGEYSMVTTEYSLVKSNFILQGTPPHARIPWRIFHGYD